MLFMIVATIIILGCIGFFWFAEYMGPESFAGAIVGTIFSGLVGCLISSLAFLAIAALPIGVGWVDTQVQEEYTYTLQQIDMNDSVRGRFFLGSGRVDGINVYNFYYKTDKGYQVGSIDAYDAEIIESDTEEPRVEEDEYFVPRWLAVNPFNFDSLSWESRYTVYVPEGSIAPSVDMALPS